VPWIELEPLEKARLKLVEARDRVGYNLRKQHAELVEKVW
jgi:hypothetical protein